mmetsp:Transcript_14186/g.26697  ORF Transcript_14186/g.26697 Transcript_14186/m.26697 type:complete len:98 (-) Transcript_14186:914-1207(-)
MVDEKTQWVLENVKALPKEQHAQAIRTVFTYVALPFSGGILLGSQMLKQVSNYIPDKFLFASKLVLPIWCGVVGSKLFVSSLNREMEHIYNQVNKPP